MRLGPASSRLLKEERGRFRSARFPGLPRTCLPPAIKAFRERRPDLRIRLFDGNLGPIARRVATGKLDLGLGVFGRMPGVRGVLFFCFSLMVVRPDGNPDFKRVSTKWSALNWQILISLTSNYPHQQLIDTQLAKGGIICKREQTVSLLDTQIALVEAGEGIAIIPSFGLPACRSRKVTMSELIEPVVTPGFYEISNRGNAPAGGGYGIQRLPENLHRHVGGRGRDSVSREQVRTRQQIPSSPPVFLRSARG